MTFTRGAAEMTERVERISRKAMGDKAGAMTDAGGLLYRQRPVDYIYSVVRWFTNTHCVPCNLYYRRSFACTLDCTKIGVVGKVIATVDGARDNLQTPPGLLSQFLMT
jgi:hypothetical protein